MSETTVAAKSLPIQALKAHFSLNVRNVKESIEFYKKMFGIEPSKVREGYAKFDVQNPPLNLAINQTPFNDRGALSHMGIQVSTTEDVMAVREQWQQAGLAIRDEMKVDCCFAIQDKTWVKDPDGNQWEVFVVLEDNLPEATSSSSCCTTEQTTSTSSITGSALTGASCCGPTENVKQLVGLSSARKVSHE